MALKFIARKNKEAKKKEAQKECDKAEMVVEHRQSVTVQTTHYVETKIDKIIELMTILNNKLGFIVEELGGIKE